MWESKPRHSGRIFGEVSRYLVATVFLILLLIGLFALAPKDANNGDDGPFRPLFSRGGR